MTGELFTQLDEESCPVKRGKCYRRCFLGIKGSIVSNLDFSSCHMLDIGAKEVHFQNCDFSHSLIELSFFRRASFTRCKFVGTRFQTSNFHGAIFNQCDFDYARFLNTEISHDQIIGNMPSYPNVRKSLLRSLRTNAVSIGRVGDASNFYIVEMDAECEALEKAAWPTDGWNTAKSTDSSKRRAKWQLRMRRIERFWWGYGELPLRLARSTLLAIFLMTAALYGTQYLIGESCSFGGATLMIASYTIGASLPASGMSNTEQAFALLAGFVGFVTLSLFVAVLLRRIARR